MSASGSLHLVVRRTIHASPARLFDAWTTASQLQAWWGPKGVRCTHAEIDAKVGGHYRIANELPNGEVVWIEGKFLEVLPPQRLVYTWNVTPGASGSEIVTVRFEQRGEKTEVIIVHERIRDASTRDGHAIGWAGCLDGLAAYA
jgi:uncharacterized protein YndB with AHSA1/START domain